MPTLDYGTVPLRDPRTGELYIEQDGTVAMIEGEDLFVQECRVALDTWRGEEVFDSMYGFPVNFVRKNPNMMELKTLLKSAVLETLDPERIRTLYEAVVVDVQYQGENLEEELIGVWKVKISLQSINMNTSDMTLGVDAPFQAMG